MRRILLPALFLTLLVACASPEGASPDGGSGPNVMNTRAGAGAGGAVPESAPEHDPGPPTATVAGPKLAFTTEGHHYGEMEKHTKKSYTAVFYNAGRETLEIRKVNTHCGCAAALLSAKELPPGGRGTMKITMDSGGLPGRRSKTVEVYTNDPETPVTKYPISCDVIADCGLDPIVLVIRATRSMGDVTAQFDVISLRPGFSLRVTKVETSNPDLEATVAPLPGGTEKTGYRVDLRFGESFGSGDFKERVTVFTNSKRDPKLYMDVFGSVRQSVLVVPERLYFPPLRPGEIVTRLVYVYRDDGKPLGITGVEDPSGMFVTSTRRMEPGRWEVKLEISGEVPQQTVKGSVVIKTDAPDEPTVPVPFEIPGAER